MSDARDTVHLVGPILTDSMKVDPGAVHGERVGDMNDDFVTPVGFDGIQDSPENKRGRTKACVDCRKSKVCLRPFQYE